MDFINEGKTGKVKLYDIYEAIYEDCDSALADDFYKGLKLKMNQKKNIDLADAEVQLYIRDFLESHENDYQYDLLKQALEPYYDHEYDLADEDVQESYEVLEETDEYLDENATFEEIIYRMECAEIYEDLYNAAMLIVDPKLQNEVTKLIQQCEDDGDEVEEAYSIVTSDLLDMHINDKNEEFLTEDINENKNSILSKVFAQYPDIDEEDEDYLNGLSYDELVNELKTRGWDDLLEESKKIETEDEESKKIKVSKAALQRFENSLRQIKPYSSSYVDAVYDLLKFNFGKDAYVYRCRKDSEMDRAIKELQKIEKIPGVYYDESKGLVSKLIYVSKDFGDYVINYFKNNSKKATEDKDIREAVEEESEENSQEFDYRLLSRLKSDCDYYLGNGNRDAEHCLWAKNEQGQIDKMREIYNKLKEKPEWLSEEDINNYAKEMGVVNLPSTTDGTAEKEIQDMLDRSEKRSKENLDESKDRFNRDELVAIKNSIDTALDDLQITSNGTTGAMADKVLVNDLRDVSRSVGSYLDKVSESKEIKTEDEDMEAVKDEIETAKEETENTDQEIEQVQGSINVLKTDEESAIDGYDTFIEDTKEVVDKELADAIENQMEEIKADEEEHIEKLDTIKNALDEAKGQAPDFKVDFEGDMTIDMGYTNEEGAEKRAKELLGDVAKSSNVRDLNVDVKDVKKIEKENKELKKEDKIIWTSEYQGDEETADEAYQEYLDEFEPSPKTPKDFEDWLEDTFEDWLEAESEAYTEEHPEVKDMEDYELDNLDYELRERVQKEIEANMDDLKEQYEEYCEQVKQQMTSPSDKESWQTNWYEQDAEAQWEVMDEDFSFNVWPMIQNQCKDDILILLGSVGRWNGTFDGGKIIHADEKNIRNIMGDYDEVTVSSDDEGHISMGFNHHDGTDGMYLYTIPEDLTELAKAMGYDDPDELDTDIRQDYVDMEELSKHIDKLTPIIYKGGNE